MIRRINLLFALTLAGLGVAGCQSVEAINFAAPAGSSHAGVSQSATNGNFDKAFSKLLAAKPDGELKATLMSFASAKRVGKSDVADQALRAALKRSTDNAGLHGLHGAVLLDRFFASRHSPDLEQAIEALSISERLDPTRQTTAFLLGHALFAAKNYAAAQQAFARAVLLKSDDREALFSLAAASYMSADPVSADAALTGLARQSPLSGQELVLRAYVSAALGDFDHAREVAQDLSSTLSTTTARRVNDWQVLHHGGNSVSLDARISTQDRPASPMTILDVVIIATEDDVSSSRGVNLLNGLRINFSASDTAERSIDYDDPSRSSSTREIIRNVTSPGIDYSLNIANAFGSRNEILAKPTLVALEGEESRFFSGSKVLAGATAGEDTIEIEDDIGVSLSLVPLEIQDGRVLLTVEVMRTFLKAPDSDIEFEFRLETSKVEVSATVDIAVGETLILGGLSERETEEASDGVPILQNIPLVQYGFKRKVQRDFQRSVLILLTPREPNYVYRPGAALAGGGAGSDLSQLQARYSDWFRPYPNWASIFAHLQSNQLYREFRTGDVALESWTTPDTVEWRAGEILNAIYF
ncbi:MAG: hypothetical protein AAF092_11100 [Pseudomonadota bacterium]